jgi:hypothetical protein
VSCSSWSASRPGIGANPAGPLRQPGEREDDAIAGFGWSGDGDLHRFLVERLAVTYGDRQAIALLKEVAGAAKEPEKYPDRQDDAKLAASILDKVSKKKC